MTVFVVQWFHYLLVHFCLLPIKNNNNNTKKSYNAANITRLHVLVSHESFQSWAMLSESIVSLPVLAPWTSTASASIITQCMTAQISTFNYDLTIGSSGLPDNFLLESRPAMIFSRLFWSRDLCSVSAAAADSPLRGGIVAPTAVLVTSVVAWLLSIEPCPPFATGTDKLRTFSSAFLLESVVLTCEEAAVTVLSVAAECTCAALEFSSFALSSSFSSKFLNCVYS